MNYRAKDVICPFFANYDSTHIKCETLVEEAHSCVHPFKSPTARSKHMDKYCCTFGFGKCPIARAVYHLKYLKLDNPKKAKAFKIVSL